MCQLVLHFYFHEVYESEGLSESFFMSGALLRKQIFIGEVDDEGTWQIKSQLIFNRFSTPLAFVIISILIEFIKPMVNNACKVSAN